jgi:hypothetical protein
MLQRVPGCSIKQTSALPVDGTDVPDFQERAKLNCGVYIIALECLSKLFYSFFSEITKTGRRQAAALSARRVQAEVKASGYPAVSCAKTTPPPYSNMKRRMLTFMSRPTHMATVMVEEPP